MLDDFRERPHKLDGSLKYPGLETKKVQLEKGGWVVQVLRRFLREQFGCPSGFWGYIAGLVMAHTPSNKDRIHWTVSLLEIRPEDRIMEIGFGIGYALEIVSKIATKGFTVGIDHSEVMVRRASKRNARAIREGTVYIQTGSASNLPPIKEPFDKIFTINSIHFWNNPIDCLKELRKILKPGGLIAVTIQPRSRRATDATTNVIGREITDKLVSAGFSQVRLEIRKVKPVSVACAIGSRP